MLKKGVLCVLCSTLCIIDYLKLVRPGVIEEVLSLVCYHKFACKSCFKFNTVSWVVFCVISMKMIWAWTKASSQHQMLFSFLFFCDGFLVEKMPTSSAVQSRFVLLSLIWLMGLADKRLWGLPLSAEALLRCYPLSWIISPGTSMLSLILLCSYFEVPL
jgi:hypothetical protein